MDLIRNHGLVQSEQYEVHASQADLLQQAVRDKWAYLREQGHVADYPVELLRTDPQGSEGSVKINEIFRWKSQDDKRYATDLPGHIALKRQIASLVTREDATSYSSVVRGFNRNFPPFGGMELLKGICSCLLTVDGYVRDYPMSVKNGVVLMHRSPGADFDEDGRREMHLSIMYHGGEIFESTLGPIRVEQNFDLPNDGIVKSKGLGGTDFPATAVWRVHWRIRTALGRVITDPTNPLVFGPASVEHYPPVGTEFHSSTGPVKLLLEDTGKQIGTLNPGQLTAFDIVVTKDDEVYSDYLNVPSEGLMETLVSRLGPR